VALHRFPPDRHGQLTRQLSDKVSDSVWHKRLTRLARERRIERSPYWLGPFENYRTMCTYLVGD
jgi:alkanesulfonate monooxygenase